MKNRVVSGGWRKTTLSSRCSCVSFSLVKITRAVFLAGLAATCLAGAPDANVRLANLAQDLELLSRQVANLSSEVEILRRENVQLRLVAQQAGKPQSVSQASLQDFARRMDAKLADLRAEIDRSKAGSDALRRHVDDSLKRLIEQMNAGFAKMSVPAASPAPPKENVTFNDDYPQDKGFVHTVEKGETVTSIARKYNSKISWILNANRISDPRKVFVGRELFVPQGS